MRTRSCLALFAVVACLCGVLAPAAAEARPGAPTGVRTTMVLLPTSAHRITSTGHAPPGSRVVLQNRFDKHQAFGTVRSGRASASGGFELKVDLDGEAYGKYRVCVVTGGIRCTAAARPIVRKRTGHLEFTQHATQVVAGETAVFNGHLSKWLRNQMIRIQYQDDHGKWVSVNSARSNGEPYFQIAIFSFSLNIGNPALKLRLNAVGTRDIAGAHSKPITIPAYRAIPWADLTPVSGQLIQQDNITTVSSGRSLGVTPAGTTPTVTTTLALPSGCGRISFGAMLDAVLNPGGATPYAASVAVDGTTLYTHAPPDPSDFAEHDITLGPAPQQLTLTTSYDALNPERRVWFVDPNGSYSPVRTAARVLCTS